MLHTTVSRSEFPDRKLYLYAAHDNNVSAFLRALQVWQTSLPPYGTAVILEVRKKAGQVGVQVSPFIQNVLLLREAAKALFVVANTPRAV